MNLNKISSLVKQLESAQAVIIDTEAKFLCTVNVYRAIEEKPDNELVYITWTDCENRFYTVKLTEQGLDNAEVVKNVIILEDSEGELTTIHLYNLSPKPVKNNW
jgi:hypothetical protein